MRTDQTGFTLYEKGAQVNTTKRSGKIAGGLRLCQPYRRTGVFLAVGSGKNPSYPEQRLIIWDSSKDENFEIIGTKDFKSPIVDLKMAGDWVVVCLKEEVYVFNFDSEEGLDKEVDFVYPIPPTNLDRLGLVDICYDQFKQ